MPRKSRAPQTYRKLKELSTSFLVYVPPHGTARPEYMSIKTGNLYLSCVMTDCHVFGPCGHAISGNDRPRAEAVQPAIRATEMVDMYMTSKWVSVLGSFVHPNTTPAASDISTW